MKKYTLDASGEPRQERDMLVWCRFMAAADRHVALDEIGGVSVSTVFLGIDHNWGEGPPILWETMVFGGKLDETQERYTSRADALAGHRRWVSQVRDLVGANAP